MVFHFPNRKGYVIRIAECSCIRRLKAVVMPGNCTKRVIKISFYLLYFHRRLYRFYYFQFRQKCCFQKTIGNICVGTDLRLSLPISCVSFVRCIKSQLKWTPSQWRRGEILFERYPLLEKAYHLSLQLGNIYQSCKNKGVAFTRLAQWYDKVEKAGFNSFNIIARSVKAHYQNILNYFDHRSTNASAESFNAKIKAFRASFRGVGNVSFSCIC